MEAHSQSPAVIGEENVINIIVIQQDDDKNILTLPQTLIVTDNTQTADGLGPYTLKMPSVLQQGASGGPSPSCQSQDKVPSYSWLKETPMANSTPKLNLHKSQSFTVGQSDDSFQYSNFNDLSMKSEFSNSLLTWGRSITSDEKVTRNEPMCLPQQSLHAETKLEVHKENKIFNKHKSVNIPIRRTWGVNAMSPDVLIKTFGQTSVNSFNATPDSGFCTPSSRIKDEPSSVSSTIFSTPRQFNFSFKSEASGKESPVLAGNVNIDKEVENMDFGDEQPLDTSLNSVHWLQTYSIGAPTKTSISPSANHTTRSVVKVTYHDLASADKSESPGQADLSTVTVPAVTPPLNISRQVSSGQNLMATTSLLSITPRISRGQNLMASPLPVITPKASNNQNLMATTSLLSITPRISSGQNLMTSPLPVITPKASNGQNLMATSTSLLSIAPRISSDQNLMTTGALTVLTPKVSTGQNLMMTSVPVLSVTPGVSSSRHIVSELSGSQQQRKVLQEVNSNIFYSPVARTPQVQKPQYQRPNYSYMDLIKMALKDSPDGQLTLKEILSWIEDHYPYFKYKAKQSWKSSVRCNLSLHPDFTKVEDRKRGGKWKMVEGAKDYMHRLPKPPVIKQPVGPKVPAVTRLKSQRTGPLPILPKSVSYALIPLNLAPLEQHSQAQNIQQQALQILQQHHSQSVPVPVPVFPNQTAMASLQQCFPSAPASTSPQVKGGLQHIAPKVNLNPPTLVWDPKLFVIPSGKEVGQSAGVNVESLTTPDKNSTDQWLVNIKKDSVKVTKCVKEEVLVSGSSVSGNSGKPVSVQIPQMNQAGKKIVFHKQLQNNQKQSSEVPPGVTTNICQGFEGNDLNKCRLEAVAVKARGICKTADRIPRSKSDLGNRSSIVSPYNRGKREEVKKTSMVGLEYLLARDSQDKRVVEKMFLMDDNDDGDSVLIVDTPSNLCPSSRALTMSRPESAPAKCLIQQAWDQAGSLSNCGAGDGHLLDIHDSEDHRGSSCHAKGNSCLLEDNICHSEDSISHKDNSCHILPTDINQTAVSSRSFSISFTSRAVSENQQNRQYITCSNMPSVPKSSHRLMTARSTGSHTTTTTARSTGSHTTTPITATSTGSHTTTTMTATSTGSHTTTPMTATSTGSHTTTTSKAEQPARLWIKVGNRSENINGSQLSAENRGSENLSNENMQHFHTDKSDYLKRGNFDSRMKGGHKHGPAIADKATSALKNIFHGLPNSQRSLTFLSSSSAIKPVNTNSLSAVKSQTYEPNSSTSHFVTNFLSAGLYRTKSRRKQIHTPLSSDGFTSREKDLFNMATNVGNGNVNAGSSVGIMESFPSFRNGSVKANSDIDLAENVTNLKTDVIIDTSGCLVVNDQTNFTNCNVIPGSDGCVARNDPTNFTNDIVIAGPSGCVAGKDLTNCTNDNVIAGSSGCVAGKDRTNFTNENVIAGSSGCVVEMVLNPGGHCLCLTPPAGTQQNNHATSSPSSDHPSPPDFASYLSTLSASSQLRACVSTTIPSRKYYVDECIHAHPLSPSSSSATPPSKSSLYINLPPSAPITSSSSSSNISAVVTLASEVTGTPDGARAHPHEDLLSLSPQLGSATFSPSRLATSTPRPATSGSHFLHSDPNFLNSSSFANTSVNDILALTASGHHFDNFLYLAATPPAGSQLVTPPQASGTQPLVEFPPASSSTSALLNSSFFDNLDSLMQNLC